MTTWNSGPYPPPDQNQGYYGGQPGYPPQPPPGAGYPNAPPPFYPGGNAPPPPGAPYGQPGGAPYGQPGGAPYGQPGGAPYGQPGGGAPYGQPGAPYGQPMGGDPYTQGGAYNQAGEGTPLSNRPDMYGTNYPEDPEVKGFGFSDQTIRRGFIRKVYAILSAQLLVTAGFICLFVFHEPTKQYAQRHIWLFIVAIIVLLVTMIALACCGEVRRKAPLNFILLGMFTLAESFLLGIVSSTYRGDTVLMAVGITAVLCFGLTMFAFQTKWDFTVCGGFLFIAVLILFIFGILAAIFAGSGKSGQIVQLVYASLGALLFSIYLIYDTQLMMGGKHKYSISPEEYIFAALNLYVDIINIFIYILTILGAAKD